MYCPRCGQQQVSDEIRFCPRCGLPLGAVARLVESGGQAEGAAGGESEALTPRQRGVRKGLMVMAAAFMLGLITLLLTVFREDFFVLFFIVALGFTFGLMRTLYGALLEDGGRRRAVEEGAAERQAGPALGGARQPAAALNPARPHAPATFTRAQTAEMAPTPSVTEVTTRLLDEDDR